MFQNHLKIAVRSLLRNKLFSFINITGLAVGLAASTVIFLWVQFERSYDRFHPQYDKLYQVMSNDGSQPEIFTSPATPSALAEALKTTVPEVANVSHVTWGDQQVFHYNDKHIEEYGLSVDPAFLRMFHFPLVKGDAATALTQPNTLLISETTAKKYFGDEEPVGKIIRVDTIDCQVVGVLKDVPKNSTLQFDYLQPADDYLKKGFAGRLGWDDYAIRTYVQLKEGATAATALAKIKGLAAQNSKNAQKIQLTLHGAPDWYLRNNFKNGVPAGGRVTSVNILGVVAIFVLLIACINFMNLSTAQATRRAKEVGVRKAIGGSKSSLLQQFLGESLLVTAIAAALAILLVLLVLPVVNGLLQKELRLPFGNPVYIGYFLLLILLTALLAGGYPAFVLASFQPSKVLKNGSDGVKGGSFWLRRSLVVVQFVVSVVIIIGALVSYRQIEYFRNKNLGYNRYNLVYFPSGGIEPQHYEAFKNELASLKGVQAVTRSSITFSGSNQTTKIQDWPGRQPDQDVIFDVINTDYDFTSAMGMELKEGRGFSAQFADSNSVLLNEEAVRQMGLKAPVAGQVIRMDEGPRTVIGVTKDFHLTSMQYQIKPVIVRPNGWTWTYYLRIDGAATAAVIKDIERTYKSRVPDRPITIHFMDQEYERMYRSEMQMGTLSKWFAGFAIFISCLGLFGLVSLAAVQRTKEIGIRKVLGASIANIVALLSKDFLKLVAVAVLIAFPLAWWAANNWLQDFAYRITIGPLVFLAAGGVALVVAMLTVSVLGLKAAVNNPVKSLRTE